MVTTTRLTFAEYLTYSDGTDTRYELVQGELVPMSVGSGHHADIIRFLERAFEAEIQRIGLAWVARQSAVGIPAPPTGRWDTSRIPDVVVISLEQWRNLRTREAVIELNEPAPFLVVEVVSETTKTTDYRSKRLEYNVREIPEYVVVDPLSSKITVFNSIEDLYEATEFSGGDRVQLQTFPELGLTAEQVLKAE